MQITKVYPLDAVFDNIDDVPEDVPPYLISFNIDKSTYFTTTTTYLNYVLGFLLQIKTNKRYAGSSKWTVQVWTIVRSLLHYGMGSYDT